MNYAFNRIKFNKQVVSYLAAQGKKKYNTNKNYNKIITRNYSQQMPEPEKDPFPSWKLIAILSGLGLYHQYRTRATR